ncbi:MAG: hypothetical protein HFI93_10145 [Lachnospiraceae bacterium]|nr:hypothetical protein [Lachnospiraceae bacterium]
MKIKIAVFGVSDAILRVIKEEIDPGNVEIVVFVDNDSAKENTFYMDVPVIKPENLLKDYEADYVLVTALSSYGTVRDQLLDLGVNEKRIQPFIPEAICQYCVGSLESVDRDFIRIAYFKADSVIARVEAYQKIYQAYAGISSFYDDADGWFDKSCLISHACGGFVKGKKLPYSNSKEALEYSIEKKFRLIECDVLKIRDDWFLAHDRECFREAEREGYTVLSLREFIDYIKNYPDIHVLIDVKWKDAVEYADCVHEVEKILEAISENDREKAVLKNRIVMEVYDEETIRIAKERDFWMIFTQYRNPDWPCCMNTVNLCYRYGIRAVAMGGPQSFALQRKLNMITEKNIRIFVFSTDSAEEYRTLAKMGVSGVFTNYLTEDSL